MYSNNSSYQKIIDTLTYIRNKVVDTKFYTIKNLPEYIDFDEGMGGLSEQVMTWISTPIAGGFESGNFGSNADNERVESADVLLNNKMFYRNKWKKGLSYNIVDVEQANQAQVVNLIEEKEKARKKNWDLGIQEIIFLGSKTNKAIKGLLNQDEVTTDTYSMTKPLSQMTDEEFTAFATSLSNLFWMNTNNTAMFDTFIMPDSDFMGLQQPVSHVWPDKTRFRYLQETLNDIARNYNGKDCKILPCSYCSKQHNNLGYSVYCLYRKDPDTLYYDMAKDYTTLPFYTYNGFDFNNIAWGMYGGTCVLRPQEMYYLTINQ